jgi:hypothetical protein
MMDAISWQRVRSLPPRGSAFVAAFVEAPGDGEKLTP